VSRTKTAEPIEVPFLAWRMDSGGSKEPCVGEGLDPHGGRGNLRGNPKVRCKVEGSDFAVVWTDGSSRESCSPTSRLRGLAHSWGGVQQPSPFQPPFRRIMIQALHDELCVVVALMWTDGRSAVVEKVVHRYLGPGGLALSWGEVQPPDSLAAPSPQTIMAQLGGGSTP